MSDSPTPVIDPLSIAALDAERHVASAGWDQPVRLFALVPTADLVAAEPHLAQGLTPADFALGALTPVEQDDLPATAGLEDLLAQIGWPDTVAGALIAVERIVVPPEAERDLPEDAEAALAALAAHPDRQDVRIVAAVTRTGEEVCLLRQRAHDRDDAVGTGANIAPGLLHALHSTFR